MGDGRRTAVPGAPPQPGGARARRPSDRLRPLHRPGRFQPAGGRGRLHVGPHPAPRPGSGRHLPREEGARSRVQPRGRRDARHLRLPGRPRDRQCPPLPRGTARPQRPGGARRHGPDRGCRVRCTQRQPGVRQPRGAADRQHAAGAGATRRRSAAGHDRAARRRHGSSHCRSSPWRKHSPRRRRSGPRRSSCTCPTAGRSPPS